LPEALKDYAKRVRTTDCFDAIVEIKKAIKNKDDASALVALGELRNQIWLLSAYIDSLEKVAASPES
jgi:hypothetical protein